MPVETLIKIRRGSDTSWTTANPTLALGEPGFNTTSNRIRVGDGTLAWSALDYIGSDKADTSVVTEIDGNVDDLITLSGVVENSTDLGTFTGTTIADNETVKGALQDLETALDTKASISVVTEIDGNVDDLITLSGVAENATDLGTFTGTTITDDETVKGALQELETYIETIAGGGSAATTIATQSDSTDATFYLTFVADNNVGATQESVKTDAGVSYNPNTNTFTATNITTSSLSLGSTAVTSTATELNVLDGIPATLTATELGHVDGVTSSIQTQLDAKAASSVVANLVTLSGVAENATNLGAFTGNTIADNETVKGALQDLETEVETKAASSVVTEIDGNVDDLITLSGVAENATNLGTFTGTTIADNETVKGALQDIETYIEAIDGGTIVDNLVTLSGVAENATDLGTFTGTTISDNETVKGALQDLETAVETKANSTVVTEIDGNVDDLITLSGVAENATDLGTFTGTTIADSETVKGALQDLETAVETKATQVDLTEIEENVDDLITLSGVAENATDLGTFTGTTIADSETVKGALQDLETAVETNSSLTVTGDGGTGTIIFATESLKIAGTANEIETSMVTNQLQVGLPASITVTDNITVGGYIAGPATFTIDPAAVGNDTGTVVIAGNLIVNGTTTTINSTTLTVDDKNIELGSVASPTDVTANGGGITLRGATDKTIIWGLEGGSSTSWNSSENFNLVSGKEYKIDDTRVLNSNSLGSGVLSSSLTTVGTIGTGTWEGTAVGAAYGGTGLSSYTAGDLVYASGATTISKLAIGNANYFLKVNSGGTAPEWSNEIDGGTP